MFSFPKYFIGIKKQILSLAEILVAHLKLIVMRISSMHPAAKWY